MIEQMNFDPSEALEGRQTKIMFYHG